MHKVQYEIWDTRVSPTDLFTEKPTSERIFKEQMQEAIEMQNRRRATGNKSMNGTDETSEIKHRVFSVTEVPEKPTKSYLKLKPGCHNSFVERNK